MLEGATNGVSINTPNDSIPSDSSFDEEELKKKDSTDSIDP